MLMKNMSVPGQRAHAGTMRSDPQHSAGTDDQPHRPAANVVAGEPPGPDRLLALLQGQTALLGLVSRTSDNTLVLSNLATLADQLFESATCAIQVSSHGGPRRAVVGARTLQPVLASLLGQIADSPVAAAPVPTAFAEIPPNGASEPLLRVRNEFGFRALSIYPIRNSDGDSLGKLFLLFPAPRPASPSDAWIARTLVDLARFVIDNDQQRAALISADQRFSSLAASIPGVVYQRIVQPDGQIRYTYISDGAKDLFGVSPEEILADPNALFDCHGPEYRENFRERLLRASRDLSLWDVEATIIARNGQRKFTHAIAKPHRRADGTVVWDGVILDATRIKEAELTAAAAATRTRETIIESLSQGFALLDPQDRLVVCNSYYRTLYPVVEDLIASGTNYEALIRAEHSLAPADETGAAVDSCSLRLASHASPHQSLERQLPSGRWVLINEHRAADGSTVILHTDVTTLKEREAALARSNRELQDFASVASHDLQEPLRKIEAFGDQLRRRSGDKLDENGRFYLERIEKASRRMRALIDDLLSYSRVSTKAQALMRCDLNKILEGVLSDLRIRVVESGGRVIVGPLPTIDGDPIQMRQLFQNLISNALKFHRKDVPPIVHVTTQSPHGNAGASAGDSVNGDLCEIQVIDNGIGFEMKYASRIFSIFQRLHSRSEYEGTGIGLATCRKITERHKGKITVKSVPGEGTAFTITLPSRQPEVEPKT